MGQVCYSTLQVNVVPSPTVAPIVAPRISKVPQPPAVPTLGENEKNAIAGHKTPSVPAREPDSRPVSSIKPGVVAPGAPVLDKTDCSEISKIDKTSQDTIKQFTKAVNEKISASSFGC